MNKKAEKSKQKKKDPFQETDHTRSQKANPVLEERLYQIIDDLIVDSIDEDSKKAARALCVHMSAEKATKQQSVRDEDDDAQCVWWCWMPNTSPMYHFEPPTGFAVSMPKWTPLMDDVFSPLRMCYGALAVCLPLDAVSIFEEFFISNFKNQEDEHEAVGLLETLENSHDIERLVNATCTDGAFVGFFARNVPTADGTIREIWAIAQGNDSATSKEFHEVLGKARSFGLSLDDLFSDHDNDDGEEAHSSQEDDEEEGEVDDDEYDPNPFYSNGLQDAEEHARQKRSIKKLVVQKASDCHRLSCEARAGAIEELLSICLDKTVQELDRLWLSKKRIMAILAEEDPALYACKHIHQLASRFSKETLFSDPDLVMKCPLHSHAHGGLHDDDDDDARADGDNNNKSVHGGSDQYINENAQEDVFQTLEQNEQEEPTEDSQDDDDDDDDDDENNTFPHKKKLPCYCQAFHAAAAAADRDHPNSLNQTKGACQPLQDKQHPHQTSFCRPYTVVTETICNTLDQIDSTVMCENETLWRRHAVEREMAAIWPTSFGSSEARLRVLENIDASLRNELIKATPPGAPLIPKDGTIVYYSECTPISTRPNGGVIMCESPLHGVSILMGPPKKKHCLGGPWRPTHPYLGAFPYGTGSCAEDESLRWNENAAFRSIFHWKGMAQDLEKNRNKKKPPVHEDDEDENEAYPHSVFPSFKELSEIHPSLGRSFHRQRGQAFREKEQLMGYDASWGEICLAPVFVQIPS